MDIALVRKLRRCIPPTATEDFVGRFHNLDAVDTPLGVVVVAAGNTPTIGRVVPRTVARTPDRRVPRRGRPREGVEEAAEPTIR